MADTAALLALADSQEAVERKLESAAASVGRECEVLVGCLRRSLATNHLTGTIPTSLGELSSLQYL